MLLAVIDTNVLVSAFWAETGYPAKILEAVLNNKITACYDERIFEEYADVLKREKFGFDANDVELLLSQIQKNGLNVSLIGLSKLDTDFNFPDKDDVPFYETARACGCRLITGNAKHFPADGTIISPAEFCKNFL